VKLDVEYVGSYRNYKEDRSWRLPVFDTSNSFCLLGPDELETPQPSGRMKMFASTIKFLETVILQN
jgi:hypothetical protein